MCLIEDFFLDRERIRKVLRNKIEGELHLDFPARQALEGVLTGSNAEKAVSDWGYRYKVLRFAAYPAVVKAIISGAPQIRSALVATAIDARHAEIIKMHTDICTLCNTVPGVKNKNGGDRDFKVLASKLLWLSHPSEIPISDDLALRAINVLARLAEKAETPDPDQSDFTLNEFCVFLKLHTLCFSSIYERIDEIVAAEFDTIFDGATRQVTTITKEDAKRQYGSHVTVIDQILLHLGSAVRVKECIIKKTTKKPATSIASVKSLGVHKVGVHLTE
jgi:hypothetical protein